MRLYLVQHGEAVDSSIDPDRPLTALGREVVSTQADTLVQSGVVGSTILHSGKPRARETAEILAATLIGEGFDASSAQVAEIAMGPNADIEPWLAAINALSVDTMLVGHQPFMGRLAAALVAGDSQGVRVCFTPGTVLCLLQDPNQDQRKNETGQWQLLALLNPALRAEMR